MRSILKQLYEGILDPMAKAVPPSPEYYSLWDKIESKAKYLADRLPVGDAEQLEEYENLLYQAYNMDIYEGFVRGFRIGVGLLSDIVYEEL